MSLARVIIRMGRERVKAVRMGEHIDRLASVSHVLFEQRILDLQREKLELQKRVADLEFGSDRLNGLLANVNDTGLTEVCKCPGCYCSKRFSELEADEIVKRLSKVNTNYEWDQYPECLLKDCFIWQCKRLGLTYVVCDITKDPVARNSDDDEDNISEADEVTAHDILGAWRAKLKTSGADCHIIITEKGCGTWEVMYGRKLTKPGLFGNTDLDKLMALFALMEDGEKFFEVTGVNYFTLADDAPASDFAV